MAETNNLEELEEISLGLEEGGGVLHDLAALNYSNRCRQATLEGFMETGAG